MVYLPSVDTTVIRVPPYLPDLSAIEKIWGLVKSRIAAKMLHLSSEMFSNWQRGILLL
jgi:transposase